MSDKKFREDNYLPCHRYDGHEVDENGFSTFSDPENNQFYFSYMEDGKVIYRSEGYANAIGRDNGIASVKRNMGDESKYSARMLPDGRWVLSLKAGNHQEIARSCTVGSEAEAMALLPSARAKAREEARLAAEAAKKAEAANALALSSTPPASSDRRDDDYLTCKNYEGHERVAAHPDFSTFEHGGEHFFAVLNADGKVVLRSERYKSTAARDNGIQSVIKNRENKDRLSIEEQRGIFYVVLKAGNHQEIARSCPYRSHAEADAFINPPVIVAAAPKPQRKDDDYLACKMYEGHERLTEHKDFSTFEHEGEHYFAVHDGDGKVRLRSEGYKSSAARDNGIQSVIKNREIKKRFSIEEKMKYFFVVLKAGNHQEIARSCPYKSHADADAFINPPVIVAAAPKPQRKDDDYLACKMYKGHKRSASNPDFSTFEHEGEYFFTMLDEDGAVRLRSERYQTAKSRDNGIQSVIKNRDIEKRWSIDEKMGYYFSVLKAGNHQEIGRSCPEKEKPALGMWWLGAPALAMAAAAIPPKAKKVVVPKDKDDDYLACKEYEKRHINDKQNNVALFKHSNGQFYFTLYENDGKTVRLRSEGFRSAKERDQELRGVLKYKDYTELYSRIERKGHYIDVLKDKTGREVGRSCLKKIVPVVAAPIAKKVIATTAVAAAATAAAAATPKKAAVASASTAKAATAASGSGFKWWWLLPLLLIPLFFMWKSCGKDKVTAVVAPAVTETPPPPPPTKEVIPPPVAAAPTCDCAALTHPVFDIPSGPAPKELTKLGRAPEFGNVHGLTPEAFFQKLSKEYQRSGTHNRFLDGIFKAMGYSNGFKDATADMFSSTTIPSGIDANIGTRRSHETVYRTLNLSGKDLQAFRIKAENNCDLHFMKTCGNHMFYCPK